MLDEDRYELYRYPGNNRYYFRRLMWGSLLSGGHVTYGGLKTYEPYDEYVSGVGGYYDANREGKLFQGAHDFQFIHQFFNETGLTLGGMTPNDRLAGNNPQKWKCIHDDDNYIVYLANPSGTEIGTDNPSPDEPTVTLQFPEGNYTVKWFDPTTGKWKEDNDTKGGTQTLTTSPTKRTFADSYISASGDWVLWLQKKE